MVAVLNVSSKPFEIAREDTGSPVSMYARHDVREYLAVTPFLER